MLPWVCHILTSCVNCYWTDARQYGIYLFYVIKNNLLQINLFYFRIFRHKSKVGLAHFGEQEKPFDVICCLQKMKQSHWLLCVAKNCDWSWKNTPLSYLTRNSLLVEMKTYSESRIKQRNIQIINEMLQKESQALSLWKPCEQTSLDVALRWLDPVFFWGYHPTLKLSGIPTFTFIESLTHRMDNI